jgi:hypothetical protein
MLQKIPEIFDYARLYIPIIVKVEDSLPQPDPSAKLTRGQHQRKTTNYDQ